MTEGPDGMVRTSAEVEAAQQADLRSEWLQQKRLVLEGLSPQERLAWAHQTFGEQFALTTSFGIQSSVLLHMLSQLPGGNAVPVIWVDTGYLPAETYAYVEQLMGLVDIRLIVAQSVMSPARMEALHGRLWETGAVADMELYHRIRKVDPLEESLAQLDIQCWASGVRRGQTDHRRLMTSLDPIRDRLSLRPVLDWTKKDVFYYMSDNDLPQHPLFDKGYSTVGDWHSSGPDGGDLNGRETRFGGLKQECGIHLPQEEVEGLLGEGI